MQAGTATRSLHSGPARLPATSGRKSPAPLGLALAALFALAPFASGLYEPTAWLPATLATLAALGAVVLVGPTRPSPRAAGAAIALGSLALLAALSAAWAPAVDGAWLEANRTLFYCAALIVLCASLTTARLRWLALALVSAGATATALYVELRMLAGSGGELFFGYRLNRPLGYVNAEAGVLLMGFWPAAALAAHRRDSALAAAAAVCTATLLLELAVLTQSRSGLLAFAASAVACLAFAPSRGRLAGVLIAAGGGLALASPWLLDVYGEFRPETVGHPSAAVLRGAALAAAAGAVAAGGAWLAAAAAQRRLGLRLGPAARRVIAVAVACAVVAGAAATSGRVAATADRAYHDFRSLEFDKTGTQRFTAGGGYRYDLWRIAVDQFRDHPLKGVGAGNYAATYYRQRRQPSDLRQAHSLEFQALGELGAPGAAAVLAFAACVLVGAARVRRRSGLDGACAAAALGVFVVWLTQTSFDWLHLLPGVTGMALVAAAVLLAPARASAPPVALRARRGVAAAAALVLIVAGAVSVGRQYLSERAEHAAAAALASSPERALGHARRAFELGAAPIGTYYVAAAAYARLGSYEQARAALVAAAAREPANSVPWLLLGDLEMRRESGRAALAAYRRSLALNPLDMALPARVDSARALIGGGS
jgi:O-antigen ligase